MQRSTAATVTDIAQISQVISDVNDLVTSIATAVEEQTITTRSIAGNVSQVATGITDMMGTVQHAATVSDTIATQSVTISSTSTELEAVSTELKVHRGAAAAPSWTEGATQSQVFASELRLVDFPQSEAILRKAPRKGHQPGGL